MVGRIQTSSYETPEGAKRYTTDIVADEVEFITSGARSGDSDGMVPSEPKRETVKQTAELEEIEDDSLPF